MKKRILVLLKRSAYDLYVACHQEPNFTSFLSQERASFLEAHLSKLVVDDNEAPAHHKLPSDPSSCFTGPCATRLAVAQSVQVVGNLLDRHKVHEHSVRRCKDILTQRGLIWDCLLRDELKTQIHNADLIVTVGGDGTLLQASHYVDSSIPILGLNSDPTWKDEVEVQIEQFDATRSRGFLCLATAENFGEVLDEILEDKRHSMELKRISVSSNGSQILPPALNDVLLAHPNPASVSRCSFRVDKEDGDPVTPFIHSRSSGLRICTGAGSTAAMQSAGGYPMRMLSQDLQYMLSDFGRHMTTTEYKQERLYNFKRS
ncbi:hypothetical protein O6H91_08G020400 [Diphasiastrum complanatum]|uniref:Uncharacterized protein n=1 Tax=Diphasiastrum complanatum TaxID=34168 RepID=A0ACC2CVL3_DIPCM|nr:hypothetical protein O6H91_08G020400 [Diphasiastrum complanatum]